MILIRRTGKVVVSMCPAGVLRPSNGVSQVPAPRLDLGDEPSVAKLLRIRFKVFARDRFQRRKARRNRLVANEHGIRLG